MSGASILLFVGSTTLAAAAVTLFAFQITAAKFERRMNRRSRTLEGPVPGRRCLSSIGLNTEGARRTPRSSRPPTRHSATSSEPSTDILQELARPTLAASATLSLPEDDTLSAAQTIRARSASLNPDAQPEQSTGPKALSPAGTPSVQRLPKRTDSEVEQEQGPATPHVKSKGQKNADAASLSPAPVAQTAGPTVAPKSHTSKRGKKPGSQTERAEPASRGSDHGSPGVADPLSLDLLAALEPGEIGGDGGLPDIFAGLNEADTGIQGLADDLGDIDGGGLPTPPLKTPQKSRR